MIKDSGERREFETGAVRDMAEGKGRFDLMPLCEVAKLFGKKAVNAYLTSKQIDDNGITESFISFFNRIK